LGAFDTGSIVLIGYGAMLIALLLRAQHHLRALQEVQ
jgi:hypothetical protein